MIPKNGISRLVLNIPTKPQCILTPELKLRCLLEPFALIKWELIQKLKNMYGSCMMPATTFEALEFS